MTEAQISIAALFTIGTVVSVLIHRHERRLIRATLLAAITATGLFQVFAYLQAGYMDPYILIALAISGAISTAIATVVGLAYRKL